MSRTAAAAADDIDPVRYGFWICYKLINIFLIYHYCCDLCLMNFIENSVVNLCVHISRGSENFRRVSPAYFFVFVFGSARS